MGIEDEGGKPLTDKVNDGTFAVKNEGERDMRYGVRRSPKWMG